MRADRLVKLVVGITVLGIGLPLIVGNIPSLRQSNFVATWLIGAIISWLGLIGAYAVGSTITIAYDWLKEPKNKGAK